MVNIYAKDDFYKLHYVAQTYLEERKKTIKMNTLVIHPQNQTTDFLSVIYKDTNWNVINNNPSKKYLKEQIKLLYEGNTSVVNFNKNNLFCKL